MKNKKGKSKISNFFSDIHFRIAVVISFLFLVLFFSVPEFLSSAFSYKKGESEGAIPAIKKVLDPYPRPLDQAVYDAKMIQLANNPPPKPPATKVVKDPETGAETVVEIPPAPAPPPPWPVLDAPRPYGGAILPFKRVIAYYGNLYSRKMGVLGEYPEAEMFQMLDAEVKKWEAADPTTPALPALHYIAVVAQGSAGADGKYRARMPDTEIDKILKMAEKIDAIVFLDIQVGFSTLQAELPRLKKYFELPNVHLGIDAEFSMKGTHPPGKVVGTFDAADINYAINFLAGVVEEKELTPKILVIHRYTQKMITNYQNITPLPEVQVVMHMDGWGVAPKKLTTYREYVRKEPVQFTGFKLFYKNDTKTGTPLMTPEELLKLNPRPIYIQYQ